MHIRHTHSSLSRILSVMGPLSCVHSLGLVVPMRLEERLQTTLDMSSYKPHDHRGSKDYRVTEPSGYRERLRTGDNNSIYHSA